MELCLHHLIDFFFSLYPQMDASSQIAERRNREFERLRGPRLAQVYITRDDDDGDDELIPI
jgi:hypothetical protein